MAICALKTRFLAMFGMTKERMILKIGIFLYEIAFFLFTYIFFGFSSYKPNIKLRKATKQMLYFV
jgi:hypothetical protein